MATHSQDHHGKDADRTPATKQNPQDRATTRDRTPSAAAQRAMRSPQELAPKHLLALQPAVGNRVVQRVVGGAVIQRHFDAAERDAAVTDLNNRMTAAHPNQGSMVIGKSQVSGDTVIITGQWAMGE